MLLAQVLKRDSNNLDLVRLIAACLVIYGHSNAFMPAERGGGDWVAGLLKFDYSGSLAVKVFFFSVVLWSPTACWKNEAYCTSQ